MKYHDNLMQQNCKIQKANQKSVHLLYDINKLALKFWYI